MRSAIEVFERDDKYDPRLDSIVRVEAGRLRSRLDEYYNGDGAADEVRIMLPRGGYSAQFERRSEPRFRPSSPNPRSRHGRGRPGRSSSVPLPSLAPSPRGRLGGRTRSAGTTIAVLPFERTLVGGDDATIPRSSLKGSPASWPGWEPSASCLTRARCSLKVSEGL